MNKLLKVLIFPLLFHFTTVAKDYTLSSPDKMNRITVSVAKAITWSISRNQEMLLNPSSISLSLVDGRILGAHPMVIKSLYNTVNQTITAVIPVRNKMITDHYNQLRLQMKNGFSIEFRAYNDGVAYRLITELTEQAIEIQNEGVEFNFNENCQVYLPKVNDPELQGHYEASFLQTKLKDISPATYGYLPLYISTRTGTKMVITESDLTDYPNLFLFGNSKNSLTGQFPKVVLETKSTNNIHLDDILIKKADYHAKTNGNRTYPWRVVIITATDKDLLENEMVYKLAKPNALKDTEWIKPGNVVWDWWNDNNIYGVNFKAGINTETYKYYIDFASEFGVRYIVLDEGWSKAADDVLNSNPQINIEELVKYGRNKNVGVILWTLWNPLDKNMDQILDQYSKWGVKGVKVDFMARADQYMVNFYERMAKSAAEHKLFVDFHGAYKPVGLNRQYPNVLNYEGVKGLEQSKWDTTITPIHNTTLPFTRMVAGPMDYTPGAMLNTNKEEFYPNFKAPMSSGTRAQQASMYVIYDGPLQMLCDNPSNYRKEPIYTHYISRFPTIWDETIALEGKIGQYVVVAKRNGNKWYIGGMTNWEARKFSVPLSFLTGKKYKVEILKDGINVEKHPADYQIINMDVKKTDNISIDMASGGGYTAILTPLE